jgi:hypothetical protein
MAVSGVAVAMVLLEVGSEIFEDLGG